VGDRQEREHRAARNIASPRNLEDDGRWSVEGQPGNANNAHGSMEGEKEETRADAGSPSAISQTREWAFLIER
jgi:hypothetical protein